jgi:16S rRNA A1518/A1519 N6-dimethyltransferase RsmA/KsgA/DIM1 with predicted DNA glycosylase/AP lyase activity
VTADEEPAVRALIRTAFQRRRQQLQRAVREAYGLDAAAALAALQRAGLAPEQRPESVAPEGFVRLARELPPL